MTTPAGSGVTNKGTTYADGSQVTSTNLNDIVDDAVFNNNAVDDTTIGLNSSTPKALFVKNSGIDTTQLADNAVTTAKLADDAVTLAKTSFINDTTAAMTLSGTAPSITFNDGDNTGTSPRISGNSDHGNLNIFAEESGADITIDADDEVILKHNGTEGLKVAADAGKHQDGTAAAGVQVSGGLYATGDVYADDHVVADHILVQGTSPSIALSKTGVTTAPEILGFDTGAIKLQATQTDSTVDLDGDAGVVLRDDSTELFKISTTAGKNVAGSDTSGAKVTGALQVTGEANIGTTKLGADSILASSPSTSDDSTKIATTAFVQNHSLQYSGTTGTATYSSANVYQDLNLTSAIGAAGRAMVIMEVHGGQANAGNFYARTKGANIDRYNASNVGGWGTGGATIQTGTPPKGGTIVVVTDSAGKIEIVSDQTGTIGYTVLAYQFLR